MLDSNLNWANLELATPWWLLAMVLAPAAYYLATRAGGTVIYSSLGLLRDAPRGWRERLHRLPAVLMALAVVSLSIAAAGPRTVDATTTERREGIAIMLVVDRSGSMDARDFVAGDYSISRLDAVKTVLREFVLGGEHTGGRPDDLIGLAVFGTYADGLSPLTLDHGNLIQMLDDVEVAKEESEASTAIGEGLALAVARLKDLDTTSKVVVLLTDGVNNAGAIEPAQAAELAANLGIKVYTIGAGTNGVAPMPVRSHGGQVRLRPQRVQIDEAAIEHIAERTGGRYFHARDAEGILESYAQIDALEKTEITELRYVEYHEHFAIFIMLALGLLTAAEFTALTVLRRLP